MEILKLSLDEFRNSRLSESGQPYDKIVVGAAIFRYAPDSSSPDILLLKRAAHEPFFPNVFELPSGKVDPDDKSLKHALIREVREETGLDIVEFNAVLEPMTYSTEKTIVDGAGKEIIVSKSAIQLNAVVSVSTGPVTLSADEHSESRWAAEEDLSAMHITDELRVVILEAFRWVTST
ncbi:NUDIX hydrolase domain-like protein [Trichoderma austrokoningii]